MNLNRTQSMYVSITIILVIIILSCTSNNQIAHENSSNDNLDSSYTTKKMEIWKENGDYQLYRNNAPYQIRGAGLQIQFLDSLVANRGNSLRTWGTENAGEVLDKALEKGLTVSMGIWVAPERHHFDYDEAEAVEKQFQ